MANDIKQIGVEIVATDKASGAFDSVNKSVDNLTESLKENDKQVKENAKSRSQSAEQNKRSIREEVSAQKAAATAAKEAAAEQEKLERSYTRRLQRQKEALILQDEGNVALLKSKGITSEALLSEAAALDAVIAKRRDAAAVFTQSGRQLNEFGQTARQTAAALRQVPAQFTDIIVSLQGGQAPLTVLLQQGGQLKDVFGGVGVAAKALGGYVLGLINPFTIAAAVVAGVGLAYKKGSEEADAFAKSLILTGNAAGATVSQLINISDNVSKVIGTQGRAAEVINLLAKAGDIGVDSFERLTISALEFERAGGGAAESVIEAYTNLAKAPLDASTKLNESMRYLTASTYEQIKSLEEQGLKVEAAKVAVDAYDSAINAATPQLTARLGLVERAWAGILSMSKKAIDATLDIGRQRSDIDILEEKRQKRQELLVIQEANLFNFSKTAGEKLIAGLNEEIRLLEEKISLSGMNADAERERITATSAYITLSKEAERTVTDEVKRQRELVRVANLRDAALKGLVEGSKEYNQVLKNYAEIVAKINEKETNKKLKEQEEAAKKLAATFASLAGLTSTYYEELAKYQKQRASGVITEEQYAKAIELLIQKQPFAIKLEKERTDALKEQEKTLKEQAKIWEAYAKEVDKAQAQRDKDTAGLRKTLDERRKELESLGLTKAAVAELTAAQRERAAATLEAHAAELMDAGDIDIAEQYLNQARIIRETAEIERQIGIRKSAQDAANEWKKAAEKIENTLTDALMRAFESGKDFAKVLRDTIVNMFKTMVLRPTIQAIVSTTVGAFGLPGAANATSAGIGGLNSINTLSTGFQAGGNFLSGATINAAAETAVLRLGDYLATSSSDILASVGEGMQASVSQFGTAIGAFGNALVGYGISKTLSGGYETGLPVNEIAAIASAVFGPIAGVIGGLVNRSFGRKLKDVGIEGTFGETGFEGNEYQFYKGGWFRSDKTVRTGIDPELDQALDFQFAVLRASMAGMADVLGLGTTAVDNFSKSVKLSFKDLDEAGIQKLLQDTFTGITEEIAASVLGEAGLALARVGEDASATFSRLSSSLQITNAAFDTLGTTLFDASLAGAAAASNLIDFFGGIDKFNQATTSYFQNFYEEAERTSIATRHLSDALSKLGIELPDSREQYRALVEAQDLATESGRQTYAALIQLSGAFAAITPVIDGLSQSAKRLAEINAELQDRLDLLTGAQTERSLELRDATDETTKALLRQIYAQEDIKKAQEDIKKAASDMFSALQRAVSDTFSALQRAVAAESDAAKQTLTDAYKDREKLLSSQREAVKSAQTVAQESIRSLSSLFSYLNREVESLLGAAGVGMTAAQGRAFIEQAISTAQTTGYLPEQDELSTAVGAVTESLRTANYTTSFELQRDRLVLANRLSVLRDVSEEQLSTAELQLKATEDQLERLDDLLAANKEGFDKQIAANDAYYKQILDDAQAQLDALNGINTSVLSVRNALASFSSAVAAQRAAAAPTSTAQAVSQGYVTSPVSSTGSHTGIGDSGYRLVGNTLYFPGGGSHTVAGSTGAQTLIDTYGLQSGGLNNTLIRTRAVGGYTPVGMTLVGEEGPELVNFKSPGMVYNAEQTSTMLNGKGVVEEIRAMRDDSRAQAKAIVQLQSRFTKLMERWDTNGMPEVRAVV